MRALVVHPGPEFSVADVHRGWIKGLRQNGLDVAEYNLGDRMSFFCNAQLERNGELRHAFDSETGVRLAASGIEATCFRWWPDLVVIVSAFFMPPEMFDVIRGRGMKVVILHTESPYEDDVQVMRATKGDLNVLNDPTNIDRFRDVAPTIYLPHAYDPDVHHPRPPEPELASDFFFCGTGFLSRAEFLEACDFTGIDVKLGGFWQVFDGTPMAELVQHPLEECMDNAVAARFYASTKASFNLYRREANQPELSAGWAMGPREVEMAACGTFFLRDPRPEGDELFPMLPTFDGPADFTDQLRWWLAHDDERQAAADKARAAVHDRTFAVHAAELLRTLGL